MAENKLSLKDLMQGAQAAVVNTKDLVIDTARAVSNSPGAAPIHAAIRQGAREIEPVLQAFPDSNVRPVDEPGQIFNPTPQLVTEQMTGKLSLDDLLSNAKDRAKVAEQKMDNHKDRGREM